MKKQYLNLEDLKRIFKTDDIEKLDYKMLIEKIKNEQDEHHHAAIVCVLWLVGDSELLTPDEFESENVLNILNNNQLVVKEIMNPNGPVCSGAYYYIDANNETSKQSLITIVDDILQPSSKEDEEGESHILELILRKLENKPEAIECAIKVLSHRYRFVEATTYALNEILLEQQTINVRMFLVLILHVRDCDEEFYRLALSKIIRYLWWHDSHRTLESNIFEAVMNIFEKDFDDSDEDFETISNYLLKN